MPPLRIASLAPSHTDWLLELGVEPSRLVACTSYCQLPLGVEVPRLKGWSNLKAADVLALKADLILTSSLCQASLVQELRAAGAPLLHQDPRSLADIRFGLLELGRALGLEAEAQALAVDWDRSWAELQGLVPPGATRPRVFVEEWHQPPMAAGNWVPELLRLAGGEPFLPTPGSPSLEVSWEEVLEFHPQVVVLSLCGLGLKADPADWMKIEGWNAVEAARQGRVISVHDDLFNRPSLRLLEGARLINAYLAEHFWNGPALKSPSLRTLA